MEDVDRCVERFDRGEAGLGVLEDVALPRVGRLEGRQPALHGLTVHAIEELRQPAPRGIDDEEALSLVGLAEELSLVMEEDPPSGVIPRVRVVLQKLDILAPPERSERALLHGLARVAEDEDVGGHRLVETYCEHSAVQHSEDASFDSVGLIGVSMSLSAGLQTQET